MRILKRLSPLYAPATSRALSCRLTFISMICVVPLAQAASDIRENISAVTGHIDLVSTYNLRGVTTTYGNSLPAPGNQLADAPESDKPALQWGADYVNPGGWYVGYFGSQINYSYKRLGQSHDDPSITSGFQENKSIENDFYGGYNGTAGAWGYTVGMTGYYYLRGTHSNALETKLGISYAKIAFNAQTLLNDVVWGNKGDTYLTLNYTDELPHKITFTASLGGYLYKKEGEFLGTRDTLHSTACAAGTAFNVSGCYAGSAPVRSSFRHLILGFTQPISGTPLTWGLQGIIGGSNRFGVHQQNKLVASLTYGF